MIAEKLDFTFDGTTRVNITDRELLEKLKAAGLVRLSWGVESGNQEILKAIRKGTDLEQIRKAYSIAHDLGIETRMSVILGLPFETKETLKKTVSFIKSLKCHHAYINVATPFPGTELYEQAKQGFGGMRLLTDDWNKFRRWGSAVIDVNDLSADDLVKWQKRIMLEFHLRPGPLWHNIRRAGFAALLVSGYAFARSMLTPPSRR